MKTDWVAAAKVLACLDAAGLAQFSSESTTVDDGGGTSTRGDLELSGTISQHDAGMTRGGSFWLAREFCQCGGGSTRTGGAHRPVVIGSKTSVSPTQFKMNMGQSSASAHWYSLDSIWISPYDDNQDHVMGIAPKDVVRFVDVSGSGDGTPSSPYGGVRQAAQNAPDGATLIFKAGSLNTFTGGSLVMTRPCTLKGYGILIGQ